MKKVVVIVDASNLYLSAKNYGLKIWPPDISKVILPLLEGPVNPVCQTHFFTSINKKLSSQQRFINHISKQGVIVHPFPLMKIPEAGCDECNRLCETCNRDLRPRHHQEKKVDIAIATCIIELAYQNKPQEIDTFIVVSDDKDIIPAYQLLRKKLNKEVIIVGFRGRDRSEPNCIAYELDGEVDRIINILDTELIKDEPYDNPKA